MPQLMRNAVAGFFLIFAFCFLGGCKNSERTWSAQVKSPDGKFIATGETLEPGGWGTGAPPETYVDLNWTSGSQKPTVVFSFNDGPNEPGGMNVGMHWLTPTHLELTYRGKPTIDFQAIKWGKVEISARPELNSPAASSSAAP